jgi:hypothetical protein
MYLIHFKTHHNNTISCLVKLSEKQAGSFSDGVLFESPRCCGTNKCLLCEIGSLTVVEISQVDDCGSVEVNKSLVDELLESLDQESDDSDASDAASENEDRFFSVG